MRRVVGLARLRLGHAKDSQADHFSFVRLNRSTISSPSNHTLSPLSSFNHLSPLSLSWSTPHPSDWQSVAELRHQLGHINYIAQTRLGFNEVSYSGLQYACWATVGWCRGEDGLVVGWKWSVPQDGPPLLSSARSLPLPTTSYPTTKTTNR